MKSLLPNTSKRQGFTLIELLVVIAIIAVLAVMGFAAFRGFTGRGNDARRNADIKAIGDALEANKATFYATLATSQFASGSIPADPTGGSVGNATHQGYCISYSTSGAVGNAPGTWTWAGAQHCPAATAGVGANGAAFVDVSASVPSGNVTVWMVCGATGDNATMSSNTVVCRNSAQ